MESHEDKGVINGAATSGNVEVEEPACTSMLSVGSGGEVAVL